MPSIQYQILNQKHSEYCYDWINKLQILYQGAEAVSENVKMFLSKDENEVEVEYQNRLHCVAYRPYLAKIINDFNSELFSKNFAVLPAADASDKSTPGANTDGYLDAFYREFAKNADLQGHTLQQVFSGLSQRALVCKKAYLGIDFPSSPEVTSLADQEALGLNRAYTYEIPTLCVIDWEKDRFGNFLWMIIKDETIPRNSIKDTRNTKIISFKHWFKTSQGVQWQLYEIACKVGEEPKATDEIPLVQQGTVSFPEIPVMSYCLPDYLWIGGLIGNLQIEHFQRSSLLVAGRKRNFFQKATLFLGAELPGNGDLNETQSDENRGQKAVAALANKGYAVLGEKDKIEYPSPKADIYRNEDESLQELVDAMHAVVNQMAQNTQSKAQMGRSEVSRMLDNHAKELSLSAFANLIKEFAPKLYRLISQGRKEDQEIIWVCQGMEDFKFLSRDQVVSEATAMQSIKIPSRTFMKDYQTQMAFKLSGDISVDVQKTIKDEIDKAVDALKDEDLLGMSSPPPQQIQDQTQNKKEDF